MLLGVPTLNRYDLLERLVDSALRGSRPPDRVLVVDNGGRYASSRPEVDVLYSGENLGVAASWNRLLAAGAWIISNDDVEFGEHTFAELAGALENGDLFAEGDGWAIFGQRPEVAERIGAYDESFFPAYYEDSDYALRLKRAGIERVQPLSAPVTHMGWASSRLPEGSLRDPAELSVCLERNSGVYLRKWGGFPGCETFIQAFNGEDLPERVRPGLTLRWEILNHIARIIGARRYLEIGTGDGTCLARIEVPEKWGVDPNPTIEAVRACQAFFPLTSEAFFGSISHSADDLDLVFIDGDHRADLVYAEVQSSLGLLSPRGVIVLHDASPYTEEMQTGEPVGLWTGDVWKAVVRLRREGVHDVRTLHTDFGLAIIRPHKGRGPLDLLSSDFLGWPLLVRRRRQLLGLIDADELDGWLREEG